jgi:hypothetical protein
VRGWAKHVALSSPERKLIAAGGVSCDPEKTIGVVDDAWSEAPNPAGRRREQLTENGKKEKRETTFRWGE